MALDARIPMLYDYYKEINGGVLVNNLDLGDYSNIREYITKTNLKPTKNYLTFLDNNLKKVADCYDVEEKYIHDIPYKHLKTVNYTMLLDKNNVMVTDEATIGITLFDLGGYIGTPFNTVKGYDTNDYRIFGYINKSGKKLKTYSYILEKDFKYVKKYSFEDIIANVLVDKTNYIEGYIVESKREGIVSTGVVHSNGTTTGLLYKGELETLCKRKRVGSKYLNVILKSEIIEFITQRTIRVRMQDSNATHAMMFMCR